MLSNIISDFNGTATNMQRHSTNASETTIPPNLLKNFNVYDILEPVKNGTQSSDEIKVDKLIDIDDCSRDSGFQDADLHPAFFDKNRDFDLVDLYQNIFVTPQHIVKKEATVETDTTFSTSNIADVGFKHFCDMLESGQKFDWTKFAPLEEETVANHDFIEKTPRVLVPKVFTESDSDPEDLINEVLMQKKMERLVLCNDSPKDISSEPVKRQSPKEIEKSNVITEFSRLNLINSLTKDSKFENLPRPSEMTPYPADSQNNNSLMNFTVRAIQKDEKVYKKKRLVKPENQTANYTKGPDFYEKSVVLPQIMARLNARLAFLDENSNQKKRLILDVGTKSVRAECRSSNVNEQVTSNSKNQASSSIKNQAKKSPTNLPECTINTKSNLTKKVLDACGSQNNISNLKNGKKEEPKLCINKVTKDIRVHVTDKKCPTCGNSSTGKVQSPVAGSSEYGKLSPVVLMEDCNKERLKALKQSQMFKEFVLKGKI